MLKTRRIIPVLNDIRSIHNVGSILRSAEALGISDVAYAGYTPYPTLKNDTRLFHIRDKLTKQIHKTSLGAEDKLNHILIENLDNFISKMREEGYFIAALELDKNSVDIKEFQTDKDIVLILGNEVDGVSKEILDKCDVILEIPLKGTKESLNVAQATAIALYQLNY